MSPRPLILGAVLGLSASVSVPAAAAAPKAPAPCRAGHTVFVDGALRVFGTKSSDRPRVNTSTDVFWACVTRRSTPVRLVTGPLIGRSSCRAAAGSPRATSPAPPRSARSCRPR
jgi:hypothetical protein